MVSITEQDLIFDFGSTWTPVKYDEHADYRNKIAKFAKCCAVDFIALYANTFWFIEVKDFRGYRIENKSRIATGELAREVARKARDSIAGASWKMTQ